MSDVAVILVVLGAIGYVFLLAFVGRWNDQR